MTVRVVDFNIATAIYDDYKAIYHTDCRIDAAGKEKGEKYRYGFGFRRPRVP